MSNELKVAEQKPMDLQIIQTLTPVQIFEGQDITKMIDSIDDYLKNTVIDSSTDKGRKEIVSLSVKVRDSKTFIEKARKEYIDDKKKFIDVVNEKAKSAVERLQMLQDRTRQPVTDYENRIKEREEKLKAQIEAIKSFKIINPLQSVNALKDELCKLMEIQVDETWEEHKDLGEKLHFEAKKHLEEAITSREKHDKEQAELEQLRKEKFAREQKENEERIAKEAADNARIEAEQKAELEKKRVEEEKLESERKIKQAEEETRLAKKKAEEDQVLAIQKAKEAEEKAEADKKAAVLKAQKDLQDKIDREEARKADEARKREEDHNHRKKINNDILNALIALSINEATGKELITAIAKGEVPHTKINY